MTFEDYIPKWYKDHPIAQMVAGRENRDFETDIMQRIDWINYCNVSKQEVDVEFYDSLFDKLLVIIVDFL